MHADECGTFRIVSRMHADECGCATRKEKVMSAVSAEAKTIMFCSCFACGCMRIHIIRNET